MLTVITKPISRTYTLLKGIQSFVHRVQGRKDQYKKYGGHYAVTRSIVEGLEKIGAEFNYNPNKMSEVGEVVFVPGGMQALKWAIKMKKKGKIKKLIAGPNQVILPTDYNGIVKSKYIDLYLVNSDWIKEVYVENSNELADHIGIWPAGVDTGCCLPSGVSPKAKTVLLYHKRPIKKMFDTCKKILEDNGYVVEVIYYGKHVLSEYLAALERNSFLVHFVEQESQGISLVEAWAMNRPTLVWNPEIYVATNGHNYEASSAPYLSSATGKFFRDTNDFRTLIEEGFDPSVYSPRDWVLDNMSDEVCAKKMISFVSKI